MLIEERRAVAAELEGVDPADVPADAVTASASGLDMGISPEYAALQTERVAQERGASPRRWPRSWTRPGWSAISASSGRPTSTCWSSTSPWTGSCRDDDASGGPPRPPAAAGPGGDRGRSVRSAGGGGRPATAPGRRVEHQHRATPGPGDRLRRSRRAPCRGTVGGRVRCCLVQLLLDRAVPDLGDLVTVRRGDGRPAPTRGDGGHRDRGVGSSPAGRRKPRGRIPRRHRRGSGGSGDRRFAQFGHRLRRRATGPLLGLERCRFDYGTGLDHPRLEHDGSVVWRHRRVDVDVEGFPPDRPTELLVESGGAFRGRFLLHPRHGARATRAERLVAVALADQVGAALTAYETPRRP